MGFKKVNSKRNHQNWLEFLLKNLNCMNGNHQILHQNWKNKQLTQFVSFYKKYNQIENCTIEMNHEKCCNNLQCEKCCNDLKCDKGNEYNHRLSLSTCHKSIGHKSTCQSSLSGNSESNMININRNQHLDIVILGLGSIINSSLSRHQLCWCFLFIQSIKRIWPDILLQVTVFDPMIIEEEIEKNDIVYNLSGKKVSSMNINKSKGFESCTQACNEPPLNKLDLSWMIIIQMYLQDLFGILGILS
jgi:hypothetical protein